jgi:hypothetical protein
MMADYYYGHFSELCHKHGMKSFAEADGGPFEGMQAGSRIDIPMSEFWIGGSTSYMLEESMKKATSMAHVNGKSIVAAESFTGEPINSKWQEYPFAMKAQGDWIFTTGINLHIFHRYAHQPHPSALPGMTMGQRGSHLEHTNTWYTHGGSWLSYLAKCQYLLQQGLYVADVACFIGEDAPDPAWFFGDETPLSYLTKKPVLPEGFAYDTVNAETILNKMQLKNGRIVLPDGMSYKILVLRNGFRFWLLPAGR